MEYFSLTGHLLVEINTQGTNTMINSLVQGLLLGGYYEHASTKQNRRARHSAKSVQS